MKEKVQRQQGGEEIDLTTTTVCTESRKLHDTINLPINFCCSDDSADEECSSEDENDGVIQDTTSLHIPVSDLATNELSRQFQDKTRLHTPVSDLATNELSRQFQDKTRLHTPVSDLATNELSRQFQDITFDEGFHVNEEALKKFSRLPVNEKYDRVLEIILELFDKSSNTADSTNKDLKARSPFRNRVALQTLHKQTPFDRLDLPVTSHLGNGGNVYVQNLAVDTQPSIIPKTVSSLSSFTSDSLLQDDELRKLLENPIFCQGFLGIVEEMCKKAEDMSEVPTDSMDQSLISPMMTSPITSPSTELYDSSYETGSPGSTVGTSPAPRTSVSSDSDLELDLGMENRSNIVIISALPNSRLEHSIPVKAEPDVQPLGEVVHFVKMSATQRLDEFSKSTSFCEKHYAIQLVKVVLISKAKTSEERRIRFSKSLLETMKVKPSKANDSDIWQLSIFAHIEFLTAKDRMQEYSSTLLSRDEQLHSLLYIAAVERFDKPMIARYVAESLAKVNYNPLEVYNEGNTILHVLAELGDSHKDVLSELLMASGADGKPLMDVAVTNKKGQSALHTAVLSPHQHLSTVLLLLKMRANPFQKDVHEKTPLHYQMIAAAKREPRNGRDLEVIRKMIQAHPLRTKEAVKMLEDMCGDSFFPSDLRATIQAEISYLVKEEKTKKLERR